MKKVVVLIFVWAFCRLTLADLFTWPTNTVGQMGPYTNVPVSRNATVVSPNAGWATESDLLSHKYRHHTRIAWLNGTTFIAHSSACTNEGDAGTQTVMEFSKDKGATWSQPVLMCPPQSKWEAVHHELGTRITYPRNWQLYRGVLYLVIAVDNYTTISSGTHEDGAALLARSVAADGDVGPLFRISPTDYPAIDGRPAVDYDGTLGPPLYDYSKIFGCWGGTWPAGPYDSDIGSGWRGWWYTNGSRFVEMNTFYADSGTNNLHRLWRETSRISPNTVYQSDCTDGGANWFTWTIPAITTIPNDPSETMGLRLADGSFAILGNPVPYAGHIRDPLFLARTATNSHAITDVWAIRQSLSSTPVYAGYGKGGGASYAHAIQVGNYLYVSYSIHKETIGFSRVLIPGVDDNNNDTANLSNALALRIRHQGANVELSWPLVYSNATLLGSGAPTAGMWLPNVRPQTISGSDIIVTLPATNGGMFYRLEAEQ